MGCAIVFHAHFLEKNSDSHVFLRLLMIPGLAHHTGANGVHLDVVSRVPGVGVVPGIGVEIFLPEMARIRPALVRKMGKVHAARI